MKTFNKKDVFTLVTAEEAIAYISKRGYFGDSFEELESNINRGCSDNLGEVFPDRYASIVFRPYARESSYGLFLPADKVKEVEEKKWRAFTLEEFLNKFSIGTKISFRRRDMTRSTYGLFEGYQTDIDETETYHKIIICNLWYTLNDLFETYEYLDEHGNWQPFGVEE